jgi:hypothetical protein
VHYNDIPESGEGIKEFIAIRQMLGVPVMDW